MTLASFGSQCALVIVAVTKPGVDLVKDIPTASAIIERIIAQAVATLTEGAKLIRP
jgi:hypothetical protein